MSNPQGGVPVGASISAFIGLLIIGAIFVVQSHTHLSLLVTNSTQVAVTASVANSSSTKRVELDSTPTIVGLMHHHAGAGDAGCATPVSFGSGETQFNTNPGETCSLSSIEVYKSGYIIHVLPGGPTISNAAAGTIYNMTDYNYNDAGSAVLVTGGPLAAPSDATSSYLPVAPSYSSPLQVLVSWKDNSDGADSFNIERSTDGSIWSQVGTASYGQTSYTDSLPPPYVLPPFAVPIKYYYRVSATNSIDTSDYSNTTFPPDTVAPLNASITAIHAVGDVVTINWSSISGGERAWSGLAGYKIRRGLSEEGGLGDIIAQVDAHTYSYSDNDPAIEFNKSICYILVDYDNAGNQGQNDGDPYRLTTGQCVTPLGTPLGVTSTTGPAAKSKVTISWTPNSTKQSGFKIERRIGPSGAWSLIGTVGKTVTKFNDTKPVSGNLNYYRVYAYSDFAESLKSDPVYADITPPAVPAISSLNTVFMKNTINGKVSYLAAVKIKFPESKDDADNYTDGSYKAWGYNIYTSSNKIFVSGRAGFSNEGDGLLTYNYEAKQVVGKSYCYSASAYDYVGNVSSIGASKCITIPKPPTQ